MRTELERKKQAAVPPAERMRKEPAPVQDKKAAEAKDAPFVPKYTQFDDQGIPTHDFQVVDPVS